MTSHEDESPTDALGESAPVLRSAPLLRSRVAAIGRLVLWGTVGGFAALIANPGLTPPGNVVTIWHFVALGILAAGAYFEATRLPPRALMIFGLLTGLAFVPTCVPDGRDMLGIAAGDDSIWRYIVQSCAAVVGVGFICRAAAAMRVAEEERRMRAAGATGRCVVCGYLLRGLPEQRCPECGTPFDCTKRLE